MAYNRKINFYAAYRHFFDHMIPLWEALPPQYRGHFYISRSIAAYAKTKSKTTFALGYPPQGLTLVASYDDYLRAPGSVVYMEHGIGHTYSNAHPSYAGGKNKERVVLFLNQHALTQEKNAAAYPKSRQAIIGTPKMDHLAATTNNTKPLVCLSFHWDCQVAPETRTAFP